MRKVTPVEAGYLVPKLTVDNKYHQGLRCDNCIAFSKGACDYVQGDIKPEGICNIWTNTGKVHLTFVSGEDIQEKIKKKIQVGYEEAGYICYTDIPKEIRPITPRKGTRCGSCVFFDENASSCKLVKGFIHSQSCCNLWKEKDMPRGFSFASGEYIKQELPDIEDLGKYCIAKELFVKM